MLTALLPAGLTLDFPYDIEGYERPRELVFSGERPCFAYRERITFIPDATGSVIEYRAEMRLTSVLWLGNPILSLLYQRVGDDATSGIVRALEAAS